jgi:hypothetical protein
MLLFVHVSLTHKLCDCCIHRYGSHVLQTVLSLVGPIIAGELQHGTATTAAESADGSATPSMHAIVLALAAEASGAWPELFGDVSGSHTARALLQVPEPLLTQSSLYHALTLHCTPLQLQSSCSRVSFYQTSQTFEQTCN